MTAQKCKARANFREGTSRIVSARETATVARMSAIAFFRWALFVSLALTRLAAEPAEIEELRLKAEKGNAIAQYNLGLAYAEGRDVPVDGAEAFAWLSLAAENGSTGKALQSVQGSMTVEQLAEGQRRLEARRAQLEAAKLSAGAAPAPTAPETPVPTQEVTTLQNEKQQLSTELATLRKELDQARAELTSAAAELAQLRASLARQEATAATTAGVSDVERARLQAQLRDAETEARTLGIRNQQLEDIAAERGRALREAQVRLAQIEHEQAALKQQFSDAEKSAPAVAPVEDSGPSQVDNEAHLAMALRSFQLVQDELDEVKASREQLAAEKAALELQLAETTRAVPVAAQAQSLREQLRQTQAQAASLAEENVQLKTRLAILAPAQDGGVTRPSTRALAPPAAPAPASRMHTIVSGDTLTKISRQYYGTPDRWTEILEANRNVLQDGKNLVVGRALRIP